MINEAKRVLAILLSYAIVCASFAPVEARPNNSVPREASSFRTEQNKPAGAEEQSKDQKSQPSVDLDHLSSISSVSPNSGQQGQHISVTIIGKNTHFEKGKTQASFGAGVFVGGEDEGGFGPVTVNSSTSVTAQIAILGGASPGPRTVRVLTHEEQVSLVKGFTVLLKSAAPVAKPGGPYSGNVGQTIAFNGTGSTAPSGQTITNYAWSFGDGSTGTGATPSHSYSSAGSFTVSLTVTDTSGATNAATTTATIAAPPIAKPGGPYSGNVGQTIPFNGAGSTAPSGQTITSYAWNFGDNSTGSGATPSHSYVTAGSFTVSLTVTDTSGAANTATTTASIVALPSPNPGGPYTGNVGQTITFNGAGSTSPSGDPLTTYAWNFGDNSIGTGVSPTHSYAVGGTFTVSLSVTDATGGTNTASTTAMVAALPGANPGGPYTGNVGQTIAFNGASSTSPSGDPLTTYAWSFGDSATGTGPTPTHSYSTSGTFTVSLTVTDASGGTNTANTTAMVNALPGANPGGPYTGNVGQTIAFNGTGSTSPTGDALTTYTWNFGDSSTGTGATPTHSYAAAGTYTVALTVTDTTGGTSSASTTATVAALPTASVGGPYTGSVNQAVTFNATGSMAPTGQTLTSYAWNFGDNTTGTGATTTHTYTTAGTFQVSVTVTDTTGGTNTASTTATISGSSPLAISGFTPTSGPIGTLVSVTLSNFTPPQGSTPLVTLATAGGGTISAPVSSVSPSGLSFVVPAGAATGNITVASGTQTAVSSGTFSVTTSSSFTINLGPSSASLIQGQQVSYAVALGSTTGFTGLATLALSGAPTGVTSSFKPSSITAGQTSVLTLSAPASQAAGTSSLSVTASATIDGQSVTQTATASLQVTAITTSLIGRTVVDDAQETPIAGVSINFLGKDDKGNATGCSAQTTSDTGGNFAMTQLPTACTGPQLISYNGLTATSPPGKYAGVNLSYTLTSGQVTTSPVLIHLPRIDNGETVQIQQNATSDQTFTFTTDPYVRVTVYAGTTFTLDDGSQPNPFPLISIGIPVDRLPDQMATSGMLLPTIVAFQPANAVSSQPVAVTFPNLLNLPPGQAATLMTLDPTHGYMVPYGTATISGDGTEFVPDPDPAHPGHRYGLVHFDWHGPAAPPPPNVNPSPDDPPPPDCGCSGDGGPNPPPAEAGGPVDLSSGIASYTAVDLQISGGRGRIAIDRVYRTLSTNAGPFGIGTAFNYSYALNTLAYIDGGATIGMSMPDGNQFVFSQVSTGTFVNTTIPSLRGAVLTATGPAGPYTLRWANGTQYQFTVFTSLGYRAAFLTSISDLNGNTTTLTLNSSQPLQVLAITDPVGRSLSLTYDSSNRVTQITDPIGRKVSYTYNAQGTLQTFTDAAGGVTSYTYDSSNNLLTVTDARGVVTEQNSYNSFDGRVAQQIEADGGVFTFQYTLLDPPVSLVAAAPALTARATRANAAGALTNTTIGTNPTAPVLQTIATDPMGNQTTYRYNPQGFLISVTDASGQTRTLTRSQTNNNLVTAYAGAGLCSVCGKPAAGDVSFTFDQFGNTLSETDALGNTTAFGYDTRFNKVSSITDPLGNIRKFNFDSAGNLLTTTDPNGSTTSYSYDSFGELLTIKDPLNNTTTISYDGVGNPVSIQDALGDATQIVFDSLSRPILKKGPLGQLTRRTYDALDRITLQIDPLGNTTAFSYDKVGNLTSLTDAMSHSTLFSYDVMNRLSARVDPLGNSDNRTYDLAGNLTKFKDRRGSTSTYTYDALNRLVTEQYSDSVVSRSYDAAGRLVQVADSVGGGSDFQYDSLGRVTSASNKVGAVQFTYDRDGRVATRQVVGQQAVAYTYDAAGNATGAALGSIQVSLSYDARAEINRISRSNGVSSSYTYDPLGRILSVADAGQGGAIDSLSYVYDANGNRSSNSVNYGNPLATPAVANTFNAGNRMQTSGEASFAYDTNGNRISSTDSTGVTEYVWDARNRLQSIKLPNGQVSTLTYDFAGALITQTASGPTDNLTQNYILDDLNNVALISNSNGGSFSILSGRAIDQHYAVASSTTTNYGLNDALGSTIAVADQSGSVSGQFAYEPFGTTTTIGNGYVFQYTGRIPVTSGLFYYRARFYDSATARFISEDPIGFAGGDINLYRYVSNNPATWIDPFGLYHCVNGANCNFSPDLSNDLLCFDTCTGSDTAITGGRGSRSTPNSSHARGQACDIGRNSNPDLSRDDVTQCFEQCFPGGYGQEESNGPSTPGTHFHIQISPVPGGQPGFAPGVRPYAP
jgi:RHS repeat-associated protein